MTLMKALLRSTTSRELALKAEAGPAWAARAASASIMAGKDSASYARVSSGARSLREEEEEREEGRGNKRG